MGLLQLNQPRGHRETTVATFLLELAPSLVEMALDPRCLVMVAEFAQGHYVQFWIECDGQFIVETSANSRSCARDPIDTTGSRLASLGWCEPGDACTPNWWVVGRGTNFVFEVCTLIATTLRRIMALELNDPALIHFWTPESDESVDALARLEARVSYREALRALRRDLDGV